MRHSLFTLLLILAASSPSMAQDKTPSETTKPKSLTPEVQTAPWAVEWWKPRHEAKIKEKESMKQVDLLWIGDSITHGWEQKGKGVWDKFYGSRNAFNIGFSGDRTEQVLWRLENGEVDGLHPKAIVIMIGTNNTGHRKEPAQETAAGVKAIIDDLQKRTPESKILLLAIFPRGATLEDPMRKQNTEINSILKTFGDNKRVFFLDISNKFLDEQGNLPTSVMADLLHPDEDGYRIWAEAIEPQLSELLK